LYVCLCEKSILREIVDEVGIKQDALSKPLMIGITRNLDTMRSHFTFVVHTSLSMKEVLDVYTAAIQQVCSGTLCIDIATISVSNLHLGRTSGWL